MLDTLLCSFIFHNILGLDPSGSPSSVQVVCGHHQLQGDLRFNLKLSCLLPTAKPNKIEIQSANQQPQGNLGEAAKHIIIHLSLQHCSNICFDISIVKEQSRHGATGVY
jgi:hypothetical protein